MPRPVLAIDSETHLITDACKAPRLVCVSYSGAEVGTGLLDRRQGIEFYADALAEAVAGRLLLVFQNAPYDLGVACAWEPALLPIVFQAYEVGAVRDVKERMKLIDLADGNMKYLRDPETGEFKKSEYNLAATSRRLLGRELDKGDDSWRLRYGELDGIPIAEWPERARRYAVDDAVATLEIYNTQQAMLGRNAAVQWDPEWGETYVVDEVAQLRAGWSLHLTSCWGMETDRERVARLKNRLLLEQDEVQEKLTPKCHPKYYKDCPSCQEGIFKVHVFQRGAKAGQREVTKNMKVIQRLVREGHERKGSPPPTTKGLGKALLRGEEMSDKYISYSEEALRDSTVPQCHPSFEESCPSCRLTVLADGLEGSKILSTYVGHFEKGVVHNSYNTIVETGRCSSFDPSLNFPRQMEEDPDATVRSCIRARDGFVFSSCDYEQIELLALAEVCLEVFGRSRLAEIINEGQDFHLLMAVAKLNMEGGIDGGRAITYEDALELKKDKQGIVARTRQVAKGPDYGLPGGMGPEKLVQYVRSQPGRHVITLHEAKQWKAVFLSTLPEMREYFAWNSAMVGATGEVVWTQPVSGRVRGGMGYTQLCNGHFQQRVADGAKRALWLISRECYVMPGSPLFGSRVVAFVHDETVLEVPEDRAHEAACRQEELMLEGMSPYIKRVKVKASPALSRYLYKGAEGVKDASGRLVPWEPKKKKG